MVFPVRSDIRASRVIVVWYSSDPATFSRSAVTVPSGSSAHPNAAGIAAQKEAYCGSGAWSSISCQVARASSIRPIWIKVQQRLGIPPRARPIACAAVSTS
jgi:hypothetical protein